MTPAEIAELRAEKYNATVVSVRKPNPDLMMIRVRPDTPRGQHCPGQYTVLGLGNWEPRVPGAQAEDLKPEDLTKLVRRSYSLSCPILSDGGVLFQREAVDWIEFYIVLVSKSEKGTPPALTPRLFMLREGDRIVMGEKITGHYTLAPVRPDDTVLFLGTGTGEAPHNYMTWDLLRRGHTGRIFQACSVRYRRDLGYSATHKELMTRYPNYLYLGLSTRDEDVKQKVYIQDLIQTGMLEDLLRQTLDPGRTHVFLCGNPAMIGIPVKDRTTGERTYPTPVGVVELLERRGFVADNPTAKTKGNIHFEQYW